MGQVACTPCCSSRDNMDRGVFIFHYGSSNPESLA